MNNVLEEFPQTHIFDILREIFNEISAAHLSSSSNLSDYIYIYIHIYIYIYIYYIYILILWSCKGPNYGQAQIVEKYSFQSTCLTPI